MSYLKFRPLAEESLLEIEQRTSPERITSIFLTTARGNYVDQCTDLAKTASPLANPNGVAPMSNPLGQVNRH